MSYGGEQRKMVGTAMLGAISGAPGMAAMGAAMVGEPKRMPELALQMDHMERGVNYAEESLNELATRLEGLVRPATPEIAATNQQIHAAPPVSGYASSVHGQATRVHRLGERIQDLLRRLEV